MKRLECIDWRTVIAAASTAAGLLIAMPSMAQTGNPKGTLTPPADDAGKTPAGRTSPTGSGDGKLGTDQGPPSARKDTNRSPGTGTAGGLPKTQGADGRVGTMPTASPNGAQQPAK